MNNLNNSGEKISFSQLINEHSVSIPIIQRDYVQGRADESEVRQSFLNALYNALKNDNYINLDFIYGNIEKESLIPLDGQQRLTTLFLLHWYLAIKENRFDKFRKLLVYKTGEIKFTYETRSSSKEFCEGLINKGINYQNLLLNHNTENTSVAQTIRDSSWFYLSWQNDPTVLSMLTMLDAIHNLFKSNSESYYKRLIDNHKPLITFQFLKLKDFKLTDDIYIKMNSRGKLLTPFETFKAWLQKYIKQTPIKIIVEKWQSKLDIEWTDIFWKYKIERASEIDSEYYNYFILMTLYFYIENETVQVEKNRISDDKQREIIIELLNEDKIKHPTFKKALNETGLNNTFLFLSYFEDDISRNKLEKVLSKLNQSSSILNMIFGYGESSKKLTLWDKTFLYSFITFVLEKKKSISNYNKEDIDQLFNWIRVCKNLVYNTTIDRPGDFVNTIQQIYKIKKQSSKILKFLSSNKNKIIGFSREQLIEERIKANLIITDSSDRWLHEIIHNESHEYFYGQIGFLLELSKISGNYNFDVFKNYALKTSAIFQNELHDEKGFIIERALLAIDDYLITRGQNKNFCKYETGTLRLREENWRRVFRDENKSVIFKTLLDKIEIGKEKQGMKNIISKFSDKKDWRYYFIKDGKLIQYCRDRNIRYQNNNKRYILLSRSQLNGYHAEYYSYALYKKYMEDNLDKYPSFSSISYNQTCGDDDPGVLFTSNKHTIIVNLVYKNDNYSIIISSQDTGKINKTMIGALIDLKYKIDGDCYIKTVRTNVDSNINKRILELSNRLNLI